MIFYIKVGSETQFLITINFYSLNMVFIYTVNERIPSTILYMLQNNEREKNTQNEQTQSEFIAMKEKKHERLTMHMVKKRAKITFVHS